MPRRTDPWQDQPVARVAWLRRDALHANTYNPNHVAPPELALLKQSILANGWTQPIVIRADGEIVDGFHRWTISADPAIAQLTDGYVPVVYQPDLSPAEQMAATVRHNRARGAHAVLPMATMVRALKDRHAWDDRRIRQEFGMEQEEIERLYDRAGMPDQQGQPEFGEGWVPR